MPWSKPYRPASEPDWVLECGHIESIAFRWHHLGDRKGDTVTCGKCGEPKYIRRPATLAERFYYRETGKPVKTRGRKISLEDVLKDD
jgi:hypothetical protein